MFEFIRMHPDVEVPTYQTKLSSGMDLRAYLKKGSITLLPHEIAIISTGLKLKFLNVNLEGQVRSRSGLAAKFGVFVLNSPGTIDADYEGEIKVILHNSSKNPFTVNDGDRIAQLIISPVYREERYVKNVERGEGGFNSTGIN